MLRVAALAVIPLIAACSSAPRVTLTTTAGSFTQSFDNGYSSITAGGDDVVVLIDDPAAPALRHVLRIRMLWHPVNGAKPNSPAATNAALHFFVLTPEHARQPGYIHYAGTGFVTVAHDEKATTVKVRNAKLTRLESRGPMSDPLQNFGVSGTFETVLDGRKVDAVLAELARTVPRNIAAPATSPSPIIQLP